MSKRQSVNGARARHENPIPNACRVGPLVISSVITGSVAPGKYPESLEEQVANVYAHIRADVEAAGGSVDDIVKINFWLKDPAAQRKALNEGWLRMFPDADSRPARHTHALHSGSPGQVQAEFIAYVS